MREEVSLLMDALSQAPSYAETQRVGRQLLAIPDPGEDLAPTQRVRLALTSSFTIDPLAAALAVECHRLHFWPSIYVDGYNHAIPSLLDANSSLYKSRPEIVFLAAELGSMVPVADDTVATEETVARAYSRILELVRAFKSHCGGLLVIFNFVAPERAPFQISGASSGTLHRAVNDTLEKELAGDPQVLVLDYDALCAYHGKRRITNAKMHYMGRIEISDTFLPEVTRRCMAYVRALKSLTRKCLVLDLDGTLWGGIVGEDGPEGIRLQRTGPGSEYYEFQRAILGLLNRGVILAVNSKNNQEDALQVLREHPDMVLREGQFASIQINWNDKASNMRAIAEDIGIGLDSLVFLDDSPVERAWVRHALPDVAVYDLPADPADYVQFLQEMTDFEVLAATEEDRQRGAMYATERARRQGRQTIESLDEFLASLEMKLTIAYALSVDTPRVAQLTRKTNQFNLTTRRYTDAAIAGFQNDPDVAVYTLRVQDAFGDSGLVGIAIFRQSADTHSIDTFLMSCRVLGRGIEKVFLGEIVADAIRRGANEIKAEYIPTPKNGLVADFLGEYGFHLVGQDNAEQTTWELPLHDWVHMQSAFHAVKWHATVTGGAR